MSIEFEQINIENDKVLGIINAAFEVFATNDFEKASTNSIVQKADVSRGLLYHYFKNKQAVFDFLVYFSVKVIVRDLAAKIDWDNSDIISRIKQTIILKFDIMTRYPFMLSFFEKHRDQVMLKEIKSKTDALAPGLTEKLYTHNIEHNGLDEGESVDIINRVIQYTLEGVSNHYVEEVSAQQKKIDLDELMHKCEPYFELFERQFFGGAEENGEKNGP